MIDDETKQQVSMVAEARARGPAGQRPQAQFLTLVVVTLLLMAFVVLRPSPGISSLSLDVPQYAKEETSTSPVKWYYTIGQQSGDNASIRQEDDTGEEREVKLQLWHALDAFPEVTLPGGEGSAERLDWREDAAELTRPRPCAWADLEREADPAARRCSVDQTQDLGSASEQYGIMMAFLGGAGLGNYMWQYATLVAAARRYHLRPLIWEGEEINKYFQLTMEKTSNKTLGENWPVFSLPFPENEPARNIRIAGYNQDYINIQNSTDAIRKEFTLPIKVKLDMKRKLRQAVATYGKPSLLYRLKKFVKIAIHVRRGDFLQPHNVKHGFTVASESYLLQAMAYFREMFENKTIFIVISNDMNWTEDALAGEDHDVLYFHETRSDDLYIAAMADHAIITVGTFGWWVGFLAGGKTIYYENYPRPNTTYGRSFKAERYYPREWIPMGD